MLSEEIAKGITLHCGDMREVLATLSDSSIDSCVTDPPYHLSNNTGSRSPDQGQYTPIGHPKSPKGGFMGKQWDGGDISFRPETWAEVYRVLKPGGHLLAFGGTRTYHRLACAVEDAGFEIRDCIQWLFGTGFPKSHDVSKAIDRAAGAEREAIRVNPNHRPISGIDYEGVYSGGNTGAASITSPSTDAAREWQGWGTALKPAAELIVVARKPLIGTVVENVLAHGTGAINVDGCRVATDLDNELDTGSAYYAKRGLTYPTSGSDGSGGQTSFNRPAHDRSLVQSGRWPANVVLSMSEDEYELKPFTSSEEKHELFRWLSENA